MTLKDAIEKGKEKGLESTAECVNDAISCLYRTMHQNNVDEILKEISQLRCEAVAVGLEPCLQCNKYFIVDGLCCCE
jgi:hypothetical protein